jgi:sugar (pentulose or hexulose) kinase
MTAGAATVAVLDVGKSNVKLSAVTIRGIVVETLSVPNLSRPGPPWLHHDIAALNTFVLEGLAELARRHPLRDFVASGHGSGCLFTGDDPDEDGTGLVLPMIDYDQPVPGEIDRAYALLPGDFAERGSVTMMGATHVARQIFWAETTEPAAFARVRQVLGLPQYWAWRLSGVAASEISILGAQSHLWNLSRGGWSQLALRCGYDRLLPALAPAGAVLGMIRPALAARYGLPMLRIRTGAHDSSLAVFRYQIAGLGDATTISTGTWIVALAPGIAGPPNKAPGITLNADLSGAPMTGALCMGGREYAAVAGQQPPDALARTDVLAGLIGRGTMALPAFGPDGGQFPGRERRGRIIGTPPGDAAERHALGILYTALLTHTCGASLAPGRRWVLDGSFLKDPTFAALVAALRPGYETLISKEGYGIAAGAALLCRDEAGPAPLDLDPVAVLTGVPDLGNYATRWHRLANGEMA